MYTVMERHIIGHDQMQNTRFCIKIHYFNHCHYMYNNSNNYVFVIKLDHDIMYNDDFVALKNNRKFVINLETNIQSIIMVT